MPRSLPRPAHRSRYVPAMREHDDRCDDRSDGRSDVSRPEVRSFLACDAGAPGRRFV
jgi:hypothetical protein